jgi:hypothetical protein
MHPIVREAMFLPIFRFRPQDTGHTRREVIELQIRNFKILLLELLSPLL